MDASPFLGRESQCEGLLSDQNRMLFDLFRKNIFLAKLEADFSDPVFEYVEKFLDSPTSINRKEQIIRVAKMIPCNFPTHFKNAALALHDDCITISYNGIKRYKPPHAILLLKTKTTNS